MKFLVPILLVSCVSHADYSEMIRQVASANNLDPELAVAVAKVESSLNPNARGKLGEVGLFQIRPKFAKLAIYTPKENIEEGIRQLVYWKAHCPVKEFVVCYNQGARKPKYPQLHPYYKKVLLYYKGTR